MEYFRLEEIQAFSNQVNKNYDSTSEGAKWYNDTRDKLRHLVKLLSESLNMTFEVNFTQKPNAQAGRAKISLKNYILVGFLPQKIKKRENDLIFVKLIFHSFRVGSNPFFNIEIDVNMKKANPYQVDKNQLQSHNETIEVNANFPQNWEDLVTAIKPHVAEKVNYLKEYLNQKNNSSMEYTEKPKIDIIASTLLSGSPLNQILYGPPGTGKTYNTINKAISIINPSFDLTQSREKIKEEFDRLTDLGQIVFSTFHQSMSYEDFIEGIKPLKPKDEDTFVKYEVQNGIFKNIRIDAAFSIAEQKQPLITKAITDFSEQYNNYLDKIDEELAQGKQVKIKTKTHEMLIESISANRNISVRHINGSRPYIVSKDRLAKISQAFPILDEVNNIDAQFRQVIGGANSSAYWGVLNAIRSIDTQLPTTNLMKNYTFSEKETVVEAMTKADYKINPNEPFKSFVLIIDEINRGNVSQIFGELITLIEENKRLGKDEALEVILPYSKKSFGVPPNLYIIGTMNTADRSVEALDTALRRRFSFEEMPPKSDLIRTEGKLKASEGKLGDIDVVKVLTTINERIEVLLGRDNLIGHSYFLDVDSEKALKNTFFKNIIPLLQEYFYGDYGKIGLVLGEGFISLKRDDSSKKVAFASFNYEDTEGLQKRVYSIKSQEEVTIQEAIKQLLNEKS